MKPAYPPLRLRPHPSGRGSVQLDIEFAGALTPLQAESVVDVIDTFSSVAELGGFSDPAGAIGVCVFRRLSHRAVGASVRFEFECSGIDHRAFQTLRNMLAALDLGNSPVKSLVVASDALRLTEDAPAPEIDEDNEERSYPPRHALVRFQYGDDDEGGDDEDDAGQTWFRRCVVTLQGSVEQQHIDAMIDLVVPWFVLLELNGYAMPLDWPRDVVNVADTVMQFEEDSIEITVMRFQSSEEAWSSLANLVWANAESIGLPVQHIAVDA